MAETGSKTVIDRVGRVAVPVSDQDRAIEFYSGDKAVDDLPKIVRPSDDLKRPGPSDQASSASRAQSRAVDHGRRLARHHRRERKARSTIAPSGFR